MHNIDDTAGKNDVHNEHNATADHTDTATKNIMKRNKFCCCKTLSLLLIFRVYTREFSKW